MSGDESLPLLKGTLDLLILKALTWGDLHGYAVASWLEARSGGELGVDDSALYQALHRLEAQLLVEAAWGVTDSGRRARFYGLTAKGRRELAARADTWSRYASSVGAILAHDGPEG
jgi:transcriptional regulator